MGKARRKGVGESRRTADAIPLNESSELNELNEFLDPLFESLKVFSFFQILLIPFCFSTQSLSSIHSSNLCLFFQPTHSSIHSFPFFNSDSFIHPSSILLPIHSNLLLDRQADPSIRSHRDSSSSHRERQPVQSRFRPRLALSPLLGKQRRRLSRSPSVYSPHL